MRENTIKRVIEQGSWLPLIDYAVEKGISVSTLRRHIKAKKVKSRLVGGKYLIWSDPSASGGGTMSAHGFATSTSSLQNNPNMNALKNQNHDLHQRVDRLERDLRMTQEQITEMRMLLALYEEKIPHSLEN